MLVRIRFTTRLAIARSARVVVSSLQSTYALLCERGLFKRASYWFLLALLARALVVRGREARVWRDIVDSSQSVHLALVDFVVSSQSVHFAFADIEIFSLYSSTMGKPTGSQRSSSIGTTSMPPKQVRVKHSREDLIAWGDSSVDSADDLRNP
eukprot:3864037-Amphidinium_carterae.2